MIEESHLAPEHCLIQYYKHGSYYGLSDMSHLHPIAIEGDGESQTDREMLHCGTWVSAPCNIISESNWLNLHEEDNYDRKFCCLQQLGERTPIYITFSKLPDAPSIDCLKGWIK